MKTRIIAAMASACLMLTVGAAHAELKDNGNGTITDTAQGLVWLKNANCFGQQNRRYAMGWVDGLSSGSCGLSDKSKVGQWRLPTKEELQVRAANKAGFTNIQADYYWSSSTYPGTATDAWYAVMVVGGMTHYARDLNYYVWPVRAVQ